MTGQQIVIGSVLGIGVAATAAWIVIERIQDNRRVTQCPHPEHRIYQITHFWCDECRHEVFPIDVGEDLEE